MIEFQEVSKEYINPSNKEKKIIALDNINLKIAAGEFICLVGPSGAGKSTLVRLLIREELPSNGRIFVAEKDITKLKAKELPYYRRKIGVVFQDFKLLEHKTVAENIAFALEVCDVSNKEIREKVGKILRLVDLQNKIDYYPHTLSGGEKQRVSIARALINSPKILIADEPTGNLDPNSTWETIMLLSKINQAGALVILATHNKTVVDRLKKRVVSIRDGRVTSDQRVGKYLI